MRLRKPIQRKSKYFVYILKCSDDTYYAGYTNDLEKRITLHNKGNGAKYLRGKRPVELVYAKEYKYYKSALNWEREIKSYTRKEKEELIKTYAPPNL